MNDEGQERKEEKRVVGGKQTHNDCEILYTIGADLVSGLR